MNICKIVFGSTGLSTITFDKPFYKGQHLENKIEVELPSGHASVTSVTLGATKIDGSHLDSPVALTLDARTGKYSITLENWYTEFSGNLNLLITVNFSASSYTCDFDVPVQPPFGEPQTIKDNTPLDAIINGDLIAKNATNATKDGDGNTISTTYIKVAQKGAASGVCPLGSDSKIASTYFPTFVDGSILGLATVTYYPTTGDVPTPQSGKYYIIGTLYTGRTYYYVEPTWTNYDGLRTNTIYIDESTNKIYRFFGSGSGLIELVSHLGTFNTPIVVDLATILAGTDTHFITTGAGTEGDPYIVKPRTTIPHANNLYTVALDTEPAANTYIHLQAGGYDRCMVKITHTVAFETYHIYSNLYNYYGYVRPRVTIAGNAVSNSQFDIFATAFTELVDVNSPEVFHTTAL